jgi:hypothetical protein
VAPGRARARPVPLGGRVDQAEEQFRCHHRVDIRAQVAVRDGLLDQRGGELVERAAAGQRLALGDRVAVHAQQEGDKRLLRDQYRDAAADQMLKPVDCPARKFLRGGRDREQAVQRAAGGQPEQLLFRRHMVIDRGLRDAERARQVLHRGRVVAALVEQPHRGSQDRLQVVPRTPGTPRAPRASRAPGRSAPSRHRSRHDPG